MVGRPVLTSPPTSEPIALTLVKEMLRVDAGDTSQDGYLTLAISTARETCESHTSRGYVMQGYREYYDGFPGHHFPLTLIDGYDGDPSALATLGSWRGERRHHHKHHFELSRSALRTFTQIQYLDMTGAMQTLDPSQYVLNNRQDPAEITPAPESLGGLSWPIALRQVNSVWIDYVVGASILVASIAANASVLTGVAGYTFTTADVGSIISIPGAGIAGAPLLTSIASVDGSGNATVAAQALTASSAAIAILGPQLPFGDIQAMLMLIGHWDANRLPIQQGIPKEIDYAVKFLLDRGRVYYQP